MLPYFIKNIFSGFKVVDLKEWTKKGHVGIFIEKRSKVKLRKCCRCGGELFGQIGKHRMRLEHLPILNLKTYVYVWREKGHCKTCNKARSEALEFVADETPHLTKEYSWWLGKLCEMSSVKKISELTGIDNMTLHRLDFTRLKKVSSAL